MAISKINKLELVALQDDKESLIALLQKLGSVELIKIQESATSMMSTQPTSSEIDVLEIEEAITFLGSLQEDVGFLESTVKLKPLVYKQELDEVISSFDYKGLLKELSGSREKLKDLSGHKERLTSEKQHLSNWCNLSLPLEQITNTQTTAISLGILSTKNYTSLLKDCKKENIDVFCDVVNQDKSNAYLAVVCLSEDLAKLESIFKSCNFNFVSLGSCPQTARARCNLIDAEIKTHDGQIQDTKDRIVSLSVKRFNLMVVYDYFSNIRFRQGVDNKLAKQKYTFLLSGWIKSSDTKLLEKEIQSRFNDVAIFVSKPKKGEDVPVALDNPAVVQPFEAVTNLYGQPIYDGTDPTGFLAPFFAISFGLCLLDAGYGLILLLVMFFYLRKKQISSYGKNFLNLFKYVSIATIIAGIITGSFFADLISRLPERLSLIKDIQKSLILFDPIKDSLVFLGLTLIIGFIQIWTGVFIKFMKDLRTDRFSAFVLDLPTLSVQASLLLLLLIFFKALPQSLLTFVAVLFSLSAISVIYYQLKVNREISLKIFWSIFGIYSIITGNFLADTLSFSRIFALGLTSGLLGMAMNTMLMPKGPINNIAAFLVMILALVVLSFGHLINLCISILGAYVHTSRLQYLEFFTKFFEAGGRQFKPFKLQTKYIFLSENNK